MRAHPSSVYLCNCVMLVAQWESLFFCEWNTGMQMHSKKYVWILKRGCWWHILFFSLYWSGAVVRYISVVKLLTISLLINNTKWCFHLKGMKVLQLILNMSVNWVDVTMALHMLRNQIAQRWSLATILQRRKKMLQKWREPLITSAYDGTWCFCSYSWED